ncbi:hypothetical protein CFter6_1400 [Collimonas fungivorans]|uniref:Uncharacterized protein n=1 Tax=Collimonas fungivorans TaxID=158899 RepID=A0A127P8F9_9BURK|nr:hypothetical protein CFter6_1400 [Collimonas fungivorans]
MPLGKSFFFWKLPAQIQSVNPALYIHRFVKSGGSTQAKSKSKKRMKPLKNSIFNYR